MFDLFRRKVVFPVMIINFEVAGRYFLKEFFRRVQLFEIIDPAGTFSVAALVNSGKFSFMPFKKCLVAVGAIILGFATLLESFLNGKKSFAYFAPDLISLDTVVEIEKL